MFDSQLRAVVVFAAWVLTSATAGAADIRADPSAAAGMGAVLEGKIESGDFEKFKNFVLENNKTAEIYLASPGGNLAEALKIGILARMLKLSTVAPSKTLTNYSRELAAAQHNLQHAKANYMCASGCFFIFVAGINRRSDGLGPAILGIHRPFLTANDMKRLGYDQAAAIADRTRSTVARYLSVMDVPGGYITAMYSVSPGRIQWIRNDQFDADFKGFIPELRDEVDAKCENHTNPAANAEQEILGPIAGEQAPSGGLTSGVLLKQRQTRLHCERDFEVEVALHARQEFAKSRNSQSDRPTYKGMPPAAH